MSILNFFYENEKGELNQVHLGVDFPVYPIYDIHIEELSFKTKLLEGRTGLLWNINNDWKRISSDTASISGYPSPDLNYIVAIYNGDANLFAPPNNAAIYHLNGTLLKHLTVPKLISKEAKERGWLNKEPDSGIGFSQVSWKKNSQGEAVLAVEIKETTYGIFREVRVLNAETGEFGECLYGAIEYK